LLLLFHSLQKKYIIRFAKDENIKSIHISKWPKAKWNFENEEKIGDMLIEIIGKIRKFKSEKNMAMNEKIKKIAVNEKIKIFERELKETMKIEEIEYKNIEDVEIYE